MNRISKNLKDMTGFTNEYLSVLEREIDNTVKLAKWKCRCGCGKVFVAFGCDIRSGKTRTCGCRKGIKSRRNWQGHNNIPKTSWSNLVHNAEQRGIAISVSIEEIDKLYEQQDRKCALSGEPLSFKIRETTASLDRIDNSKGYVAGNIQWVHKDVNKLKGTFSQARLIDLCKRITKNVSKKDVKRKAS